MRRLLPAALLLAALWSSGRADPSFPALDAAAAAWRSGESKKALSLLSNARRQAKTAGQRQHVALLYAELKDYRTARSMMAALIRESPDDPVPRLYLATIVARAGDRGATLAALAEARARGPGAQDRQRMAFLHQDLKDYGPARELLDELVAERPADLSVRLDRASLAAQSGDGARARAHLAAASALSPGPEERRRMAGLHRDLRDYGRARELLDGLIKENPGDPRLRLELASLSARQGDRPAALEALKAASSAGDREASRRAAGLYRELEEFGEARALLQRLTAEAPRDADARLELATLDARLGAREAALASLAAVRALEPDLQQRQRMSLIYHDLKEFKTARRLADELVAEQPQDPQLRLNRAYFAAETGDKKAALAFLEETGARAPDPDDRRRMATLYARLGEHAAAREILDDPTKISR